MPDIRTFLKRFRKKAKPQAHNLTMRQVLAVKKTKMLPSWKQWKQLPSVLSLTEKKILAGTFGVALLSVLGFVGVYVTAHRIDIPAVGGTYTEGLVGEPQFINPLYSINSDVDQDIASLVYSGLVKWNQDEGFVPDLAESLTISEDGTVYTFKIRDNAKFHNGEDVRTRDVLFTINAIQNQGYRSPLADKFHNVTVIQDDDKTVSFILDEPFTPFIQYLTVGILPAGVWAEILPQNAPLAALNLQPIGSGPYKFAEFTKDKKGSIRSYTLERNDNYYQNAPYIETLTFKFYSDESSLFDALENKNVEGISFVEFENRYETEENKNVSLLEPYFPNQTILYFNQEVNPSLEEFAVREAISSAINKDSLVNDVFAERARVIHAPVLPGVIGYNESLVSAYEPSEAESELDEAGYEKNQETGIRELKEELQSDEEGADNTFRLTITTLDQADLRLAAEHIQENLRGIGIEVDTLYVSTETMNTEIIPVRNFELLLAPIALEADPDPYLFWHSSQTEELNIAGYSNDDVDTLIEEARVETDEEVRAQKYQELQEKIVQDVPVVFLYQSTYGYALSSKIHHTELYSITNPSDRFVEISEWYIKTKKALR